MCHSRVARKYSPQVTTKVVVNPDYQVTTGFTTVTKLVDVHIVAEDMGCTAHVDCCCGICCQRGNIYPASESERTSVGEGTYACGDPHRLGIRPAWVVEAGIPSLLIRFHPQRLENRLIRHGCQTIVAQPIVAYSLENRVIRYGNQTSRSAHTLTSKLENRMIRLGCHTGRCSCLLPRRSHAQGPDRRHGASCRPFRAIGPLRTDWRTVKKERHRKPQK